MSILAFLYFASMTGCLLFSYLSFREWKKTSEPSDVAGAIILLVVSVIPLFNFAGIVFVGITGLAKRFDLF